MMTMQTNLSTFVAVGTPAGGEMSGLTAHFLFGPFSCANAADKAVWTGYPSSDLRSPGVLIDGSQAGRNSESGGASGRVTWARSCGGRVPWSHKGAHSSHLPREEPRGPCSTERSDCGR